MIKREPDTLDGNETAMESVAEGLMGTSTTPVTSFDGVPGIVGFAVGDAISPTVGLGVGGTVGFGVIKIVG